MAKYSAERLGTEPVPRLLISMCTQTTLALMLYSVYTLTDAFFLARFVSAYAAGSVALSLPIMIILGAVATTVGTGGGSIISRALGKGDTEKAAFTAANTFIMFWLSAAFITIIGLLLLDPLMRLLGADDVLMPYAKGYTRIILIGAITSTGFSAIIRAEGNTRFSLYIWVFPVLVNLICDPIFIILLNWGVEGAAIATVLAQATSAGMSVYYFFFSKRDAYKLRPIHFKLKPKLLAEIASIGSPSLISQVSTSFIITIINQILLYHGGAAAITAFGISARIQGFLAMPQTGIVQGMHPIIGYNYASKALERVKSAIKLSVSACVVYGILIMLAGLLFARSLTGIFITDSVILGLGASALALIALSFPFKGVPTIVSAVFQAEGRPVLAAGLLITGIFAVQLPVLLLMSNIFSLTGVWLSFLISDALMSAVSISILIKFFNKNERKVESYVQ